MMCISSDVCGVSALSLGGSTLHSLVGATPLTVLANVSQFVQRMRPAVKAALAALSELVIDGVGLMALEFFNFVSAVLCRVRGCAEPFGGVRLIMCGDFMQVSIVLWPLFLYCPGVAHSCLVCAPKLVWQDEANKPEEMFRCELWSKCNITVFRLTDALRQRANGPFADWMAALRVGNAVSFSESLSRLLPNQRYSWDSSADHHYPVLCGTRAAANSLNENKLREIAAPIHVFEAVDSEPELDIDWPVDYSMDIKIGMPVMCVAPVDFTAGICNGTCGAVTRIMDPPDAVEVKFTPPFPKPSTSIVVSRYRFSRRHENHVVTRSQLPLIAAWGLTIHKLAGVVLSTGTVDCANLFAYHHVYSAFSRFRTLDHVSVINAASLRAKISPSHLEYEASLKGISALRVLSVPRLLHSLSLRLSSLRRGERSYKGGWF
jgi:ATP-dependent DNA helicase PIF1